MPVWSLLCALGYVLDRLSMPGFSVTRNSAVRVASIEINTYAVTVRGSPLPSGWRMQDTIFPRMTRRASPV